MMDLLKYQGRKVVLPSETIKNILQAEVGNVQLDSIVDFGSGTLYWANWLTEKYQCPVYAVDTIYEEKTTKSPSTKIVLETDIVECLQEREPTTMVWMCDVLHHLQPGFMEQVFELIMQKAQWIVLKDIDANKRFGNFMNHVHDKIINGETIHDIYPNKILEQLQSQGYTTSYHYIPKLWYPHFLLIARKKV